ncbi:MULTISPECIES: DUF4013 domain-containing protein [Halobellus]|uniref:DUF4013 domain-containing protein n=1 Tax=Halobellus TaxID=1073986 RepID=UPI00210B5CBB|nr:MULTISPECIES: DUF4013 domain-containing protein [Halobellus]MDQ2053917.1 DUF4013 domain-containing protein [Halobellus sp. H-GB7]
MIQDSLQYLRNDENWVTTVLIGGILSLLGVLIVPTLLVLGYLVRVVRGTMHGEEQPPVFDEWGDLFTDGLKAFVVVFVYGLIPGIIAAVVVGGGIFSFVVGGGSDSAGLVGLGMAGILLGSLLALVLSLLAAYVVPAAISNLAQTDQLGSAFSISELRPVLTSGTYATAWVYGFALIIAASLVAGALNVIPLLGLLAGGFLGFYAAVSAYYLIGQAWGEIRDVEMRESDSLDEQAAV